MKWLPLFALIFVQDPESPSPRDHFGFPVGQDRTLFTYSEAVGYFRRLAESNPKIRVRTIGQTTLGRDLTLLEISSPENLRNSDRYRQIARRLAAGEGDAAALAREGKAVVLFLMNIHSTEIMSSQTVAEMVHKLVTGREEGAWLDNVILLVIPSANPDGQEMVVDWYRKHLNTEFEGGPMPWLYHHYAGHDTNRDWFAFNLAESGPVADVMYREWVPQVVVDFHQMGATGARYFIPPYKDPPHPDVHPLVWRELSTVCSHIAQEFEEAGKGGVLSGEVFSAWFPSAAAKAPWWHNQVSILFEAASCRIATPVRVEETETDTRSRQNLTHPWKGGWWRPRDIVDYQLISGLSVLKTASMMKESFLKNMHTKAGAQIERATTEGPFAIVIDPATRDRSAVRTMLLALARGGVQIRRTTRETIVEGRVLPAGTPLIPMAQPNYGYIRALLLDRNYPDWASEPYDVAGWALPRMFGVGIQLFRDAFEVATETWTPHAEEVRFEAGGWGPDPACTDAATWVNRCLGVGVEVRRNRDGRLVGTFEDRGLFEACRKGLDLSLGRRMADATSTPIKKTRIGIYKPWQASMDEGWLRWTLDRHEFEYSNIEPARVGDGAFEIILIPDIDSSILVDGRSPGADGKKEDKKRPETYPPEYRKGMGKEGVEKLEAWVRAGGTLIAMGKGSEFASEKLPVPVRNLLKGVPRSEFSCPGSVLHVRFGGDPLAIGMPEEAGVFFEGQAAFGTELPFGETDRRVVATFASEGILKAGYLNGERKISSKPVVVDTKLGQGRVILFGFSPHFRGQSYGTFKMLFNAIWSAEHR